MMSDARKKIVAGLFSLLLVGVAVYFLNTTTSSDKVMGEKGVVGSAGKGQSEAAVENEAVAKPSEPVKKTSGAADAESENLLQQREQLAQEKQRQIDALIVEYDSHLSDREKRVQLQSQINALMEEYNQLVLPVAMAKLKATQPERQP